MGNAPPTAIYLFRCGRVSPLRPMTATGRLARMRDAAALTARLPPRLSADPLVSRPRRLCSVPPLSRRRCDRTASARFAGGSLRSCNLACDRPGTMMIASRSPLPAPLEVAAPSADALHLSGGRARASGAVCCPFAFQRQTNATRTRPLSPVSSTRPRFSRRCAVVWLWQPLHPAAALQSPPTTLLARVFPVTYRLPLPLHSARRFA